MINIALLGAGRIGNMHAGLIAASSGAILSYVFDTYHSAADELAAKHGAIAVKSVDEILADDKVDALLIATSTDTHVEFIVQGALAGKAILCEKPIDLSTETVVQCWEKIKLIRDLFLHTYHGNYLCFDCNKLRLLIFPCRIFYM